MVFVCRNMLSMVCVCVYCFFWDLILCIWENGIEKFVFSKASDEEMKEAVEVDKKWSQKMESSKKSSIQNVTDLIEQVHVICGNSHSICFLLFIIVACEWYNLLIFVLIFFQSPVDLQ